MKNFQALLLFFASFFVCTRFYAVEGFFHATNAWQSNTRAKDPFVSHTREGAGIWRLRAQKEAICAQKKDSGQVVQEKAEEKARADQTFYFEEVPLLSPYFAIVEANSSEYKELQTLHEQYQFGDAKRYKRRLEAIAAVKRHEEYAHVSHTISDDVRSFLNAQQLNADDYYYCYGNQLQQVIHTECVEILKQTVALPATSVIYDYKKVLAECSNSAVHYNKAGMVHKALTVADFCWALLDYGKAAGEGIANGVIGAVRDMVEHPIETALCIVAGEYVLAYQLSKVVFEVAEIGLISLADPAAGSARWQEYIAPITNILTAIEKKEISLRDAIKGATQFAVHWKAQGYLLQGLGNFYRQVEKSALSFVQQYPSELPEAYMATPEGDLLKISGIAKKELSIHEIDKRIEKNITLRYKEINQGCTAVIRNGYYEVNGFKFTEYYYKKLWEEGRRAPSLIAQKILENPSRVISDTKPGFFRYEISGWEMIYNPITKEVWHLQPVK